MTASSNGPVNSEMEESLLPPLLSGVGDSRRITPIGNFEILLEDGISKILLEDGSGFLLKE